MEKQLVQGIRLLDRMVRVCAWPGKLAAWLSLGIIVLSLVSIVSGLFRLHVFLTWANPVLLFGTELNSTSIQELQWHLFAVMMLFAGSYTYSLDGHVRVDILYGKFSVRGKLLVNVIGDYFFLLPFAAVVMFYSIDLVKFAYMTHEASSSMGLTHRYLVKAILPAAMFLLCIQAACRGTSGVLRFFAVGRGLDPTTLTPVEEGGNS